jgi:hypothetical protein
MTPDPAVEIDQRRLDALEAVAEAARNDTKIGLALELALEALDDTEPLPVEHRALHAGDRVNVHFEGGSPIPGVVLPFMDSELVVDTDPAVVNLVPLPADTTVTWHTAPPRPRDPKLGICDRCEHEVPRTTLVSRAGFLALCADCDPGRPGGKPLV